MKNLVFVLIVFLAFASCDDEEPIRDRKGSIFVTVLHNFELVPNAQISTEPITNMATTDLTGTAIISAVPIGGYKVKATHPNIGSGSASITVTKNEVMDVTINLIGNVFENPSVTIQSPINQSSHNLGDEIQFSASVDDESDSPNELSLKWSSNLDGTLNENPADASGLATFSTSDLSEGDHLITLTAIDSDELETSDQVNITVSELPDAVTLNPVNVSGNGLDLDWTISTEPEFSNYRITRSENFSGPYQVIDVVSDLNTTSYTDSDVTFGTRYYYQIVVVLDNNVESFSNIESQLYEGDNIDIGVKIVRMILDPSRPYIYALDQINNSMLFINKETKELEKTIFVGSSPADIDINLDNSKAYVANYGSTQIAVIDLETQEKVDDLFVDIQGSWDGNPYRISCLSNNRFVFTSEDQWCDLKLVNSETGTRIFNTGSIYQPGLLSNSTGDVLFVTESGSSGSATIRYNHSGNELIEVDESEGGGSFGHRDGCISGNDKFIFHRRIKYLTNNLSSELGVFNDNIIDCNYDGSVAIGEENIWNAETFSIIKPLPVSSRILRLDSDENTIYIYDNNTSKIFITTVQ